MKYRGLLIGLALVHPGLSGCHRDEPSAAISPTPKTPTISKTFPMKGVARKVDAISGEITIAHEAIPGFMPKMTMPFLLDDKAALAGVGAGDEVEGSLAVSYEGDQVKDVDLVGLKVVHAASKGSAPRFAPDSTTPEALAVGATVPDFAMTTQEGQPLRLSDLRGESVILTFIYTRCPMPEFCPAMDAKFAELARRISAVPGRASRIHLLSVSFDPEHDTPEVLAKHAARRGAKPPLWTFAVASHEELAKVVAPLGMTYVAGTREIEHNLRAALIDPDGKLARLEVGPGWSPAAMLKAALALNFKPDRESRKTP